MVHTQNCDNGRAELVLSQNSGVSFVGSGTKTLGLSSTIFPGLFVRSWVGSGVVGTQMNSNMG